MMVDYERKMIVKKSCKYGEYGLFEHLLFLLFYLFGFFFFFWLVFCFVFYLVRGVTTVSQMLWAIYLIFPFYMSVSLCLHVMVCCITVENIWIKEIVLNDCLGAYVHVL